MQKTKRTVQKAFRTVQETKRTVQEAYRTVQKQPYYARSVPNRTVHMVQQHGLRSVVWMALWNLNVLEEMKYDAEF